MPKSRGRQSKKIQRPTATGRRAAASPTVRVGRPDALPPDAEGMVDTLLDSDDWTGDVLVELLLPLLWLDRPNDVTGNPSVDCAMVLQVAYAQLGITARVRCVTLLISKRGDNKFTRYGRLDPCWDGTTFDGHCVLWLPRSGRLVDATVERFREARRPHRAIVFGRAAFTTDDSPIPRTAGHIGDLPDGQVMPVQRGNLILGYRTTDPEYRDVATAAPIVAQVAKKYRRAGINLASHALTLLRIPDVAAKLAGCLYPRLPALLAAVGDSDFIADNAGDFHFIVPVDGVDTAVRLDDLQVTKTVDTLRPDPPLLVPHVGFGDEAVRSILKDVDTQARVLTRPTEAMGGGTVPVVLFAPRFLVEAYSDRGAVIELQSAGIIAAGFAPFSARTIVPARLPDWSVRRTRTGVELWDQGGLWARAEVAVDDAWLAAADAHGSVRVIYGVQVGVRRPEGVRSYTDAERDAELMASRDAGVVAAAEVPWRGRVPHAGGAHRPGRPRRGNG